MYDKDFTLLKELFAKYNIKEEKNTTGKFTINNIPTEEYFKRAHQDDGIVKKGK